MSRSASTNHALRLWAFPWTVMPPMVLSNSLTPDSISLVAIVLHLTTEQTLGESDSQGVRNESEWDTRHGE